MFTGIIETTGVLKAIRRAEKSLLLGIAPETTGFDVPIGASVSINGACLTLESVADGSLFFSAVHETLNRTTFKNARIGDVVNLERALRASDRFDGHVVLGHVDGVGPIVGDCHEGISIMRSIRVAKGLMALMAEKGSVALDGISLTIAKMHDDIIEISFIPHTLKQTTMGRKAVGDTVNVECDVLARYVARRLDFYLESAGKAGCPGTGPRGSLMDKLERSGF
jgi:riboflavin synthase